MANQHETNALLLKTAGLIREMSESLQEVNAKLASLQHERRCEKVASRMESLGIDASIPYTSKVATLSRLSREKLAQFEGALDMLPGRISLGSMDPSDSVQGDINSFLMTL